MCGIAGYISLTKQLPEQCVKAMADVITHRGPDGSGVKQLENIAIAHRRLSIIDIAAGAQPMSNVDQSLWITYNGELYNYLEIKSELEKKGVLFKTKSDTEVIIYAYQTWGAECLQKFRGMFAFAIADLSKKEIFLARDHFGIKPLYVYKTKNEVAFGSELQQFRVIPEFNKAINTTALDNYLWLQYIPAPLTIFKHVEKLKPAHYLTISFNGEVSDQINYWDINFSTKNIKTKSEWLEATSTEIKNSVRSHLVSDVPFGAFLSGGIDSTLVVKYMSETLTQPVKTFSIGFDEKEYSELAYSEKAAKVYGTEHYTHTVTPDALALLPKLVKHYGEPFGDSSAIPTYYVCELARKHVTMVLSGDGGDEGFAGYSTYLQWAQGMPANYRTGLKKWLYLKMEALLPDKYPRQDTLQNWLKIIQSLDSNWRSMLWHNDLKSSMNDFPQDFEHNFKNTKNYSYSNKAQYMDMKTYMPFDILTKVDVASMMHSLEVRTPLIDRNVWEFAATIPEEFLIGNKSGKWEGKLLLKELLAKDFPQDFISRKKQGFAVPLSKWFGQQGQLRDLLNDRLLGNSTQIASYFNKQAVSELINSTNTEAAWLLLFLEEWLQQFNHNA